MSTPNVTVGKPYSKLYAMIDDFLVDTLIRVDHTFESEVSEYPVESGATITDNVRNKPMVVTMECFVSNSPIGPIRAERSTPEWSTDECYEHLMVVRANRKPVTIRTSIRTYENVVLKNLSIPRNSSTGDAMEFTATFQQIEFVKNKRVRTAIPTAQKGGSLNKPATPVSRDVRYVGQLGWWYDPNIQGWRQGALKGHIAWVPHWDLYRGRPEHVTIEQWNSNRAHWTDDVVRALNQAGHPNQDPSAHGGSQATYCASRLQALQPGWYTLR